VSFDDPDARRVYADWLMDRGDPRGDYIVAATRLAENPDDEALADEVAAREVALGRAVLGDELQFLWQPNAAVLCGGFVDEIDLRRVAPELAAKVFANAPIRSLVTISSDLGVVPSYIRRLRVTDSGPAANLVAALGGRRLSSLSLALPDTMRGRSDWPLVRAIAALPLTTLELRVRDGRVLEQLFAQLPESVRSLTLRVEHERDNVISKLLSSPVVRRLEKLALFGLVNTPAAEALAALDAPSLAELDITGEMGSDGAAVLAASPLLRQLRHFGAKGWFGARGIAQLATALRRCRLSSLSLVERQPYGGFDALVDALPPTLRALNVGYVNNLDRLASSSLELRSFGTRNAAVETASLLSSPPFAKLRRLDAPMAGHAPLVDVLLSRPIQRVTSDPPWDNLVETYGCRLRTSDE
jgi:uncharacterized protein (TIGR02996 family)